MKTACCALVELENDHAPPPDKDARIDFILLITSDGNRMEVRSMVDLCKMAELYNFRPMTKGSCSIKKVLPAMLAASPLLQERYSGPFFGAQGGVLSLNFVDWIWWRTSADGIAPCDPYALMPALHGDIDATCVSDADADEALANGAAAMVAYARLQFEQLGDDERRRFQDARLKYCDLNTLAMIMILQAWQAELE